jgi:FdhD protein
MIESEAAQRYLDSYFKGDLVDIYWADTRAFLDELLPLNRHLLLVSGRASFEIVQKALAARISLVVAVSAPSSLAVDFAQKSGQTLVGFTRADRLNVYSHAERVDFPQ